ncbi:MAG: hypothetical protein M5T61_10170 [Acidimicrobiia bacterium]|nr:hypothetical protein [Acidimicrobiia bacterium]
MGWALAVDSMDELRELSQRIGSPLSDILGRSGDGAARGAAAAERQDPQSQGVVPGVRDHGWPRGLPQICLWEDVVADHPDTIAEAATVAHTVQPNGISWGEVGDEAATRAWIGPAITEIDIRFRDAPAGLYAVGIRAESAEIVVRREPAPLELGRLFGR